MDKMIVIEGIRIPTEGWVKWQGDSAKIDLCFKKILRLEPFTSLTINDVDVEPASIETPLRMAAIFEWGGLLSNRSLKDNILLPIEYHGRDKEKVEKKIDQLFSSWGYAGYLDLRPYYVPRNVQKLTSIVRAFLQEPDVLFIQNLTFALEDRDQLLLKTFLLPYTKMNLHFSDQDILGIKNGFATVDVNLWEKVA